MTATWRDIPSLRDPARFEVWCDRILVNACRLTLRRRVRSRVREVAIASDRDGDPEPVLRSVAPPDERTSAEDELERAFDRLTVDQRALLVMHHLDGHSLADIAAHLAIPVGTAKSRLHHARRALEQAIERERR
jgi:RNA polymerase sigma-70 factor (ECF subfamily)